MDKKILSVVLAMVCAGVVLVPLIAYATFFFSSTPVIRSATPSTGASAESSEIALGTPIQEALEAGESTSSQVNPLGDPMIVGMIIGGVVLLILLVLIIVFLVRRSKRTKADRETIGETVNPVAWQSQLQSSESPAMNFNEMIPAPAPETMPEPEMAAEPEMIPVPESIQEPVSEPAPEPVPEAGVTTVLWTDDSAESNNGTLTRKKNGQNVVIDKDIFTIGKDAANNDFCVTDNSAVSRRHATIRHVGLDVMIEDNNSTNGTFVNGARVAKGQSAIIRNGDVIMLANEEFVYSAS